MRLESDKVRRYSARGNAAAASVKASKFCVEGEFVTMSQIAERIGVSPCAARHRHSRLIAGDEQITWAALRGKG